MFRSDVVGGTQLYIQKMGW